MHGLSRLSEWWRREQANRRFSEALAETTHEWWEHLRAKGVSPEALEEMFRPACDRLKRAREAGQTIDIQKDFAEQLHIEWARWAERQRAGTPKAP